jgi:hypothetical protein
MFCVLLLQSLSYSSSHPTDGIVFRMASFRHIRSGWELYNGEIDMLPPCAGQMTDIGERGARVYKQCARSCGPMQVTFHLVQAMRR